MQCNQAGIDLIKSFEGCKLTSYQDQSGIWTIGYGQTGPFVFPDMAITQEQADNWLINSIQAVSTALSRMIKVTLNDNQFSALVSLAYNIGLGNFASSSVLALLNAGELDQVPAAIMLWDKVNHKTDNGLVRRRTAEVALFSETPQHAVTATQQNTEQSGFG